MSLRKGQVVASLGLRQLLSDDPGQLLLYALEQVQPQAHHRRLGRVLKRLTRRDENPGWLHVSDAEEPCDRVVGARLLGYRFPESIGPRQQRILDNGQYVHLRWQNYFLSLPPAWQVEIAKVYRIWPLIGEADVVVEHPAFGRFIVEIKSMNSQRMSALREPPPEHRAQLNHYLGLAQLSLGFFLYENKNDQEVSILTLQPSDWRAHENARERAIDIAGQVLTGRLPKPCGHCPWDEKIGNLIPDESRVGLLAQERNKWMLETASDLPS